MSFDSSLITKLIVSLSFGMVACSSPELTNPNHPGKSTFVNSKQDTINALAAHKLAQGIELSILGSQEGMDGWLVKSILTHPNSAQQPETYELTIVESDSTGYLLIDSLPVLGDFVTYVSYGLNDAGISRAIDTLEVNYNFGVPELLHDQITSQDSNLFRIYIIPDSSDMRMLQSVNFIPNDDYLNVREITDAGSDTIIFVCSEALWQSEFQYEIKFWNGDISAQIHAGSLYIGAPLIVAELRFKGATGLRFEGDFETLANRSVLDDTDTIRVNHKYIQHLRIGRQPNGHPINLDQNGHCRGDSIQLPDSLSEIIGSFSLWGWTEEDTFTYKNILPTQTVIPHMLDMMEYIEPPPSSSIDPFYMDKFETSFGMWAETTSETFIPDLSGTVSEGLLDSLMGNIDGLISLFSSDLIPLAGVSKDALSTFFDAAVYRQLPTQSQWRFAGTGEESGYGIPMLNQALILNENCNYANSGDMVEGPFHYFQAVPIDFFSTQDNDHYLVDDNRPVVSPSPYGIYQMAGNVMEWIRVPSSADAGGMDTVLVGGSFWSPSSDPLFQVEEFYQPDSGLDARADWGFRTVINDVDNSLYLKQITLE